MHRCHSHRGRARCDCHPGYQLAPDGKACQGGCPESSCAGKWLCLVGEGVLSVNRTEGSVPEMAQVVSVRSSLQQQIGEVQAGQWGQIVH